MPGILGNMLRNIWTVNLKLELLFSNFSVFQTKRRKAFAWGMDKRHDRCPSGFVGHWFQDSNRHQEPQTLKGKGKSLSRVRLLVTPWTAAYVRGIFQARVLEWGAIASSPLYKMAESSGYTTLGAQRALHPRIQRTSDRSSKEDWLSCFPITGCSLDMCKNVLLPSSADFYIP